MINNHQTDLLKMRAALYITTLLLAFVSQSVTWKDIFIMTEHSIFIVLKKLILNISVVSFFLCCSWVRVCTRMCVLAKQFTLSSNSHSIFLERLKASKSIFYSSCVNTATNMCIKSLHVDGGGGCLFYEFRLHGLYLIYYLLRGPSQRTKNWTEHYVYY